MPETIILLLGGVFTAKLIEQLEKEQKVNFTKEEILSSMSQVTLNLAMEASKKEFSDFTVNPEH